MKKFLLKTRLAVFVLLGFFAFGFGPTHVSAQLINPTGAFTDGDVGKLVAPAQAIIDLNQEIGNLDGQLLGAPSEALKYKRKFYYCISESLEQGVPVAQAIDANFIRFVAGYTDKPVEFPNTLGTAVWNGYYADVFQMLMN